MTTRGGSLGVVEGVDQLLVGREEQLAGDRVDARSSRRGRARRSTSTRCATRRANTAIAVSTPSADADREVVGRDGADDGDDHDDGLPDAASA